MCCPVNAFVNREKCFRSYTGSKQWRELNTHMKERQHRVTEKLCILQTRHSMQCQPGDQNLNAAASSLRTWEHWGLEREREGTDSMWQSPQQGGTGAQVSGALDSLSFQHTKLPPKCSIPVTGDFMVLSFWFCFDMVYVSKKQANKHS